MTSQTTKRILSEGKKVENMMYNGVRWFPVVEVIKALFNEDYEASREYWRGLKNELSKPEPTPNCLALGVAK